MPKTISKITQSQTVTAKVGEKTLLVNVSPGNLFVTDDAIDSELESLTANERTGVLNAAFALKSGMAQPLPAGTYNLSFAANYATTAVLIVESKA